MAAQTNGNIKNLNNWVDGLPSVEMQQVATETGKLGYWVDGLPYAPLYPSQIAGNFMPFFWGF